MTEKEEKKINSNKMLEVYDAFGINIHVIPSSLQSSLNNVIKEIIKLRENEERVYLQGNQQAWLSILQEALKHLRPTTQEEVAEVIYLNAIKERTEATLVLRRLCEEFGDNEWEDELYLADIIDKHLGKYLYDWEREE